MTSKITAIFVLRYDKKMMTKIDIQGQTIHYTERGAGRAVVLLHGWGANLQSFGRLIPELEKHFKVYALDFPGFGESPEPTEVWGVEEYTVMVENFVRKLEIEEPVLLGHSFGGRVSIVYASRNPVRKLILADAAGIKPRRSLKYYVKVYSFKFCRKMLPFFVGRSKAKQWVEQYRKKSGSSDYNNASGVMRNILVKVVNQDLKSYLPHIQAPTLLIWGENDTATPVRDAKIMERLIPDSGLAVLKNAGHFSFLDKPYEFQLIMDSFLTPDKREEEISMDIK